MRAIPMADSSPNPTFATNAIEGFDHDDMANHPCNGKWCPSCKRKDCPDFIEAKRPLPRGQFPTPTSRCPLCHRNVFGDQCYNYHLQRRSLRVKSICNSYKKCPDCCHVYEPTPNAHHGGNHVSDHLCGWGECHICEKKVHLATHKCYIQTSPRRCRRTQNETRPSR